MVERNRVRLLTSFAAAMLLPGLSGCGGPYQEAPPRYGYPPYYYDYHYYPDVYVYFHIYTGWYYYWYDGIWWRSRDLPPYIHLHPRYRVLLQIRDEYPYIHHDQHRLRYPPPPAESPRIFVPSAPIPSAPMPPREGFPPPAAERPLPPRIRPDPESDKQEREYNLKRYDTYKKKPWFMPWW